MHPGKRTFLLSMILTAAFASAAHAQTTMAYRFKEGDKLHYLMEQKTKSTMSVAGTDIEMKVNVTVSMTWQVLKVDSQGAAQVKVKVTHSKMSMDSLVGNVEVDSKDKDIPGDLAGKMLGQLNRAIAAMEISATVLPTGEMRDMKVADETVKAIRAVAGADKMGDLAHPDNFKDMISGIVFPSEAITKGKSWTNKTETKSPAGTLRADNVYTLEGTITKDGVTLEKIALNPKIKIEPNPKAEMKVKSIKATGQILFDNKAGRVVESTFTQTKVGTVSVMGLVLDQVTEEATTIRLQKPPIAGKSNAAKTIASIKLGEDDFVEKVVFTEQLETLPGVARSFTVERGYERAVTITGGAGAEPVIADEIRALVEATLGEKLGKRVTVKESISLDGKEITKVNVQWVERSRRGTAIRSDGSTVAFLVKVGLRIKLEKAK
jgi:hypothetical protein